MIILKFEQYTWLYYTVMSPKDADGIANSVDPDQTAPVHCLPRQIYPKTKDHYGTLNIHVVFSWAQIGRSAIFGREIGVPDREIFLQQKYSILVSKIVICSTVDHCKMFQLPAYG